MNQPTNYIYLPLQPTVPPAWLSLSLKNYRIEEFGEKGRPVFFCTRKLSGERDLGSFMHGQFLPFSVFIIVWPLIAAPPLYLPFLALPRPFSSSPNGARTRTSGS